MNSIFRNNKLMLATKSLIKSNYGGYLYYIKKIIREGTDVDIGDIDNNTPLMALCHVRNKSFILIECIKLLIDAGANVNVKNNSDKTALWLASFCGPTTKTQNDLTCVELLLAAGAKVNSDVLEKVNSILMAAVDCRNYVKSIYDIRCVQLLINNGADYNYRKNNYTVLMVAALCAAHSRAKNDLDCVTFLIDSGADINIAGYKGFTLLDLAIIWTMYDQSKYNIEFIKMLINKGAIFDLDKYMMIVKEYSKYQRFFDKKDAHFKLYEILALIYGKSKSSL